MTTTHSIIRVSVIIFMLAGVAQATSVGGSGTCTGSLGNLQAQADFVWGGGTLTVTLSNTSPSDVLVPTDVLTALFFEVSPMVTFTPVSATVGGGSTVLFGTTDPGGVVGGEWAYNSGLAGTPCGGSYGLSSVGLGLFGPSNVFPGSNLQGPADPDGLQYGLTSAGDDPTTGNTPVTGTNALIQDSVVFVLTYSPDVELTFSDVCFQYGTSLTETSIPGDCDGNVGEPPIPEPVTMASCALALSGLGLYARKRRQAVNA